ncbi:hypothetical protein SteCoe_9749 [Stentor coeruleus]|uniref:DnaJ homolog subfamily C member 16 n=1 Tax=Stentor coeruleus TaxID=5963 RepID=A0A1R2CHB3_9CILI|nr:hypothetical protein SteCoe_9749 [Stentor coeruleus]
MKWVIYLSILYLAYSKTYYEMLGVARDADEKVIKKAFKKVSLEHHPDRSGSNSNSGNYFKELSHAYEVLIDPEKREIYDYCGEDCIINGMNYQLDFIKDCYFGNKNPNMFYHTHLFYDDTAVIELNDHNIKSLYRRNEIWLVQFYGPRCRTSRDFVGEWISLANRLSGIVKVAAVNCDENENICTEYNIKKYSPIIVFSESTIIDHEFYQGERSADKMTEFAISRVQGFLRYVNSNNIDEFLQSEPTQVKVLCFTNTKECPALIKAVSREFKGQVLFGEVRISDKDLVEKYKVTSFPSLYFVCINEFEKYNESLQRNYIENWIFKLIDSHKVLVFARELNRSLYATGFCNPSDSKFCVLCFDPSNEEKGILDELAREFENDPVNVFWMSQNKYQGFYSAFEEKCVIYRGKKQKFMKLECGMDHGCYRQKILDAISGQGMFVRTKSQPEISEKKPDL